MNLCRLRSMKDPDTTVIKILFLDPISISAHVSIGLGFESNEIFVCSANIGF